MIEMREILFRGKRLDNGEWVEGALFQGDDTHPTLIISGRNPVLSAVVDPSTVGQYVGFSDSNGKKVYEDDIIRKTYKGIREPNFDADYVLLWADCAVVEYAYVPAYGEREGEWTSDRFPVFKDFAESGTCALKAVVIGNIHENLDLIPEPEKLLE